jgi:hypothetical protein
MLKTKMRKTGTSAKEMKAIIERQVAETDAKLEKLAEKTVKKLQSLIVPHRQGSTGNLAKNMTATVVKEKNKTSIGILDTDLLNKEAPYWYVLSYGAKEDGSKWIPPPTKGTFSGAPIGPQIELTGVGTQKFTHGKRYRLIPKTFRHIPYIQKTEAWVAGQIKKIFK